AGERPARVHAPERSDRPADDRAAAAPGEGVRGDRRRRLLAGAPRAAGVRAGGDGGGSPGRGRGALLVVPRAPGRLVVPYKDVALWEIHEAFAAQVLYQLKALEAPEFLRKKVGAEANLGTVPRDNLNPNGGSVALGHPFGATGARIPEPGGEGAGV